MRPGTGNSSNPVLREYRPNDYDALVALWDESRLPYKPHGRDKRDRLEREITKPNAIFLLAEVEGKLVGSVLATHDGRKGWINRLAVAPAFRQRGIARMLLTEAEDRLSRQGIEIVACLVEDGNVDSMRFFEKFGYTRFDGITYFTKRKHTQV
jgi:ribosomal protein S18 acetylase RimI-like enzyme